MVAGAAVVAVVALVVGPPTRSRRRAAARRAGVLDTDARSAAQLRAASEEAAAAGDYSAAVLDRFRALIRSLADRALLEERPGLTAHEAAIEAARRLPGLEVDLVRASVLFDRIRYGRATAGAADAADMRVLDETATASRPTSREQAGAQA